MTMGKQKLLCEETCATPNIMECWEPLIPYMHRAKKVVSLST